MYCDYTELSRDFTLSFRKSHQFEVLKQIKQKNAKYYHWSKGLKNVIKFYGQRNEYNGKNGKLSRLRGPFYCGMSVILNLPEMRLYIRSPISTSIHLAVAVKFSSNKGMVLEMNNHKGLSQNMMGMDVSWISRFREEEERYVS